MKAIIVTDKNKVEVNEIPTPATALPQHLLVQMHACGINAGDAAFIAGFFPPGSIPVSQSDIAGVSGVGTVIETGPDVPDYYKGKKVTIYRSLQFSEHIVGTWSDYAHVHYLQCAVLFNEGSMDKYAGSLVNIITCYAFIKQVQQQGHNGIICTAGNSATGIAMLGLCQVYNIPVISIVRNEAGKQALEALGAKQVLVQTEAHFKQQLQQQAQQLQATAVFDGVGGTLLNDIIPVLPFNSTIYVYGFLGGATSVSFHTSLLMRGITITGFSNFKTITVQDRARLQQALEEISHILHLPHFETVRGQVFAFNQVNEALQYAAQTGARAVLYPSL
ncbi:MAG: zinc-binding dehydrogenase [Niastella sp.]|uniref:zinc-binding dehydrogenase n=1 Tax=Niastella sp. TaxID=1869183 RepID=UPI00389A0928